MGQQLEHVGSEFDDLHLKHRLERREQELLERRRMRRVYGAYGPNEHGDGLEQKVIVLWILRVFRDPRQGGGQLLQIGDDGTGAATRFKDQIGSGRLAAIARKHGFADAW